MMLIRTEYAKLKPVRYISHLELMDTFRRAMRRAGLPVAYTQGYNPHIKLSLGQPLAVGMTGKTEYFDLGLVEKIPTKEFKVRLNKFLPDFLKINKAKYVSSDIKSLQAVINTAVYQISLELEGELDQKKTINQFVNLSEIRIVRKRRNKEDRVLDLKPMIYNVEFVKPGVWDFTVSTGSSGNVRPSELIRALAERYKEIKEVPLVNVVRKRLFVRKDKKLYRPFVKRVVRR